MTRVSENSSSHALKYSLNKTKAKVEDLQLKGSTLKEVTRPSDNPLANVESLEIKNIRADNEQFIKNANYALLQLETSEQALVALTDILNKAKEIAIAQASDFYSVEIRRNIANEVVQLKKQALTLGNKRIGNKFIFGGYKTLTKPFDNNGNYYGDKGYVNLEVSKDFFVPINLHGDEIFYAEDKKKYPSLNPIEEAEKIEELKQGEKLDPIDGRDLASVKNDGKPKAPEFQTRNNIFSQLDNLTAGLENGDTKMIQNLLPKLDESISRIITLRTKVGSISSSIESAKNTIEADDIAYAARNSKLVDADIGEVFADLQRQNDILRTTYKASQSTLNQTLIDFLR